MERSWIAHFGAPQQLISDEGRPWLSQHFDEWTSSHGIEHVVAPGEAHERLAVVERRHAALRKAVEVYCDNLKVKGKSGIREALVHCVPQMNAAPTVAGFSPSQWVLGYQPQLGGSLLSTSFKPSHYGGHETFETMLNRRSAAHAESAC